MYKGQVRIIGGQFRGRKLKIATVPGLRPTPDRVKETLFNWMQDKIKDANCLDAFAGSGALGFEALSRGAAFVDFFDSDKKVIKILKEEASKLRIKNLKIYQAEIPNQLQCPEKLYDIVFLDPPYSSELLLKTFSCLDKNSFLADDAYVYFESNSEIVQSLLPASWSIIKSKKAGQVFYFLAVKK